MIKYIGSKRRLAPVLAAMAEQLGVRRALDLFTGTTRVAAALKAAGVHVTAVDTARYAHVFAQARIETDADTLDVGALDDALAWLQQLPGRPGYVTETFCRQSRYFQPFNGERIDAVRDALERELRDSPLFPVLLTSLIEAADRVDSTTGVQMAYVKRWSARSGRPLELRRPELLAGPGIALRADACEVAGRLGHFDLAYLDPPYNQHRYYTNYHVWETLVAWDAPEHYGVACKRLDSRAAEHKSVFNRRREMPGALAEVVRRVDASLVVLSYNDEAWLGLDELVALCAVRGAVAVLAFEGPRYVGAQIGIHNPAGARVGTVGRLRNLEYLLLAGPDALVREAATAAQVAAAQVAAARVAATRVAAARVGTAAPDRSRRDVVDLQPINVAGGLSI